MTFAVDSNLLIYAIDADTPDKQVVAADIMIRGAEQGLVLPAQVLGEFLAVMRRKFPAAVESATMQAKHWSTLHNPVPTAAGHLFEAAHMAQRHRLQFWDSVILAVSRHASARILLSEDMQDGLTINGTTVVNPFIAANRRRVEGLFEV